jgi:hypothetical protein
LNPIDEETYLALERQYNQLFRAASFPDEFSGRDYMAQLIGADKSPNEVNSLIQNGYLAVTQAPPAVRQAFGQFFGVYGDSALAALILDPDMSETALSRMAATAGVAGTGADYGFAFDRGLAEEVVSRGLQQNARQTYAQVAQARPLFTETATEGTDLTESQGLEAAFGYNADAQQAVARRAQERQAAFGGRSQTAVTERGAIGLGEARQ